ncbi:1012_t:CDS:10 [Paraglomus occultum]|uniref:HECT-type E3 ubiquitin transferase n=1 Tax=Paraglomus occultum TaxID=144539 RepID=A0A9N8VLC6_9GLOM|nr:1012_t:CDS:10 [Paraglomus occultum]
MESRTTRKKTSIDIPDTISTRTRSQSRTNSNTQNTSTQSADSQNITQHIYSTQNINSITPPPSSQSSVVEASELIDSQSVAVTRGRRKSTSSSIRQAEGSADTISTPTPSRRSSRSDRSTTRSPIALTVSSSTSSTRKGKAKLNQSTTTTSRITRSQAREFEQTAEELEQSRDKGKRKKEEYLSESSEERSPDRSVTKRSRLSRTNLNRKEIIADTVPAASPEASSSADTRESRPLRRSSDSKSTPSKTAELENTAMEAVPTPTPASQTHTASSSSTLLPATTDEPTNPSNSLQTSSSEDHHAEEMDDMSSEDASSPSNSHSRPTGLFSLNPPRTSYIPSTSSASSDLISRLRDPEQQLIALHSLSERIAMAQSEDQITSTMNIDAVIRELVAILRREVSDEGAKGSEIPIFVCRCLANLVDLFQNSAERVISAGVIPVLCSCLVIDQEALDFYIDLPESAINALLKLSTRKSCTSQIVREGGLSALALVSFLGSSGRDYINLLANCAENFPTDCFNVVRDNIIPNLNEFLCFSDPRAVEQACLAVSRLVDSFRHKREELEAIISDGVLRKIIDCIRPNSNTRMSPSTIVHIWRMLSIVAHESPKIATSLIDNEIKLDGDVTFLDILYEALTGFNPNAVGVQLQVPKNQSQFREILGVISELLPALPTNLSLHHDIPISNPSSQSASDERNSIELHLQLLTSKRGRMHEFGKTFLPTLINVYNSTVNATIRLRIVVALAKTVHYFDEEILNDILQNVSFAVFLSGILQEQQEATLVIKALQLAELLMQKLPAHYEKQFFREGVMHEIAKLADTPESGVPHNSSRFLDELVKATSAQDVAVKLLQSTFPALHSRRLASSRVSTERGLGSRDSRAWIIHRARCFREGYIKDNKDFSHLINDLKAYAAALKGTKEEPTAESTLKKIATLFSDSASSISSFELVNSGLMEGLLEYLTSTHETELSSVNDRRRTFLHVFLGGMDPKKAKQGLAILLDPDFQHERSPVCPAHNITTGSIGAFELLAKRLQESLNRSERFEVTTAFQTMSIDLIRNPTGILAKHLKLRLISLDNENARKISIQSLVPFKAIEEWLMWRIDSARNRAQENTDVNASASATIGAGTSNGNDNASDGNVLTRSNNTTTSEAISVEAGSSINTASVAEQLVADILASSVSSRRRPGREINTSGNQVPPNLGEDTPFNEDIEFAYLRRDADSDHDDMHDMNDSAEDPLPTTTSRPSSVPSTSTNQRHRYSTHPGWQKPKDWHIEFYIDGTRINPNTRVYAAIHRHRQRTLVETRFWETTHEIKYRRVEGPPSMEEEKPEPLDPNDVNTQLLNLLRALFELNEKWDEIYTEGDLTIAKIERRSVTDFINHKLTAKFERQMEEPLIVASKALPSWCFNLAREYPFLFPFETRHTFLQSTSFGFTRMWNRWHAHNNRGHGHQEQRREEIGSRLRIKTRITRANMLQTAFEVMKRFGTKDSVLEVEYYDEIGSGLGPTLEFYSTISKELCKKSLRMWKNYSDDGDIYVNSPTGLYPMPMSPELTSSENGKKIINLFKFAGQFVAKAMVDSRIIDIPFNPIFLKKVLRESVPHTLRTLRQIDEYWSNSLGSLKASKGWGTNSLGLQFTLPGCDNFELISNGSNIDVTPASIQQYTDAVISAVLDPGVEKQVQAFREGFNQVFPIDDLKIFTTSELVALFGNEEEDWSIETMRDSFNADHGYSMNSPAIRNLLEILSGFNVEERRLFLQFVTGSPRLPIGGFKNMRPVLTIVCRGSDQNSPDESLPSVMTCQNYLKLPDYPTKEIMREKLCYAMREGQGSFHLS